MESFILSTPPQNKFTKAIIPQKPIKKHRLRKISLNISNKFSPSTSNDCKNLILSNVNSVTSQSLNLDEESSETDEEDIFSATDSRLSSPFSDNVTSPFFTPTTELKKNSSFSNVTLALNNKINSSINDVIMKEKQKTPCHRISKPKKSILVLPKDHLNILVGSSNGSLEDATIYATEINASITRPNFKLPLITKPNEQVIIPVNSEIKEKYKKFKKAFLQTPDVSDQSDSNSNIHEDDCLSDEALIRGFEYESVTLKTTIDIKTTTEKHCKKKITWNIH